MTTTNPYFERFEAFRFLNASYDELTGIAQFKYAFDNELFFTEELTFLDPKPITSNEQRDVLNRILTLLHLSAGISYFKGAIPRKMVYEAGSLPPQTIKFIETFYRNGLGEFTYKNKLSLKDRISLSSSLEEAKPNKNYIPPKGALIPFGGGKDSWVSIELLKGLKDFNLGIFILGDFILLNHTSKEAEIPVYKAFRKMDPLLSELNSKGAFNGHVPISALYAFSALFSAILNGYDTVAISQERSASSGNLHYDGIQINHQYSKSFEFEKALSDVIHQTVSPHISYFSLLRPLSEIQIIEIFSHLKKYHLTFSSCNTWFKLDQKTIKRNLETNRWCLDCPKCRFVYLALAPYESPNEMVQIFGTDLLNDPNQLEGYLDLVDLGQHKPFECVGEFDEARAFVNRLFNDAHWKDAYIVSELKQRFIEQGIQPTDEAPLRSLDYEHQIPTEYFNLVYEATRTA